MTHTLQVRRKLAHQKRKLFFDDVVGSQPELGPAPPDGGYGWVILLGVVLIQITVPNILVTSGLMVFHIVEDNSSIPSQGLQWIWIPTIFYATWNLADPWSLTMTSVANSSCMAITGIIFIVLGLLLGGLISVSIDIFYIFLGLLAGFGASMVLTQCKYLLDKYFSTRLTIVNTLSQVGQAIGEIAMPILIGCLLDEFGLTSTLLLQSAITLQGVVGAVLFRKPKYVSALKNSIGYSLLKDQDINEDNSKEGSIISTSNKQGVTVNTLPNKPSSIIADDTSDDEPITDGFNNVDISDEINIPTNEILPEPLFNDKEFVNSNPNTAFFIEDSEDDIDLYVRRGHFTNRTVSCAQELKMLCYPVFYFGLFVSLVTKISLLSFWILLPLLAKSKIKDNNFFIITLIFSLGGIVNLCSVIGSHWLHLFSARSRKMIFISSSFITAIGLYVLSSSYSWFGLICACLLIRLGSSVVLNSFHTVFRDVMGESEAIKSQTLLDTLTGLLIMLEALMISSDFEISFKILASIQLATSILWTLLPIMSLLCNIY